MREKILITGATGFIGKHVLALLASRNYELHITTRSKKTDIPNVIQHETDILDIASTRDLLASERFSSLIHLAWYVGKKCHSSDCNMGWVSASLALLQSFHEFGGETFLGAGTVSEYEYEYGYLVENQTPTNPGTLYGESKNSLYKVAKSFCANHGMKFQWPRIFNLYGPGEKPTRLMPSVINDCLNNRTVQVSDCLKFQDYLYVEDSAAGIVSVFEHDIQDAVNICSGEPVQLKAVVNRIAELTHFQGEIAWGAIPNAFENDIVVGSNDRLKSTGWKQRYTLEEGLINSINWWKGERDSCNVQ